MTLDDPVQQLTARELEVLRLASVPLSSKEIARRLVLSPTTIDRHIANAMRKLGVSSRMAAIRLLLESPVAGEPPEAAENLPTQSIGLVVSSPTHHTSDGPRFPRPSQARGASWLHGHGLVGVVARVVIDALLVVIFVAVLAVGVFAIHWIIERCEAAHVDHGVILILKVLHYVLVCIDAVGLVMATTLLTFRFVKALKEAQ